jgi:hypothetical protein
VTQQKDNPAKATDSVARLLGVLGTVFGFVGLIIALASLFLNYSASTPVLGLSAELISPIQVMTPLHFTMRLENFGKTTARHLNVRSAYLFQRVNLPVVPNYSDAIRRPHSQDLAPGAHVDLTTIDPIHLEHDHDVDAVMSGQYGIVLFGKITYEDALHLEHEFHYCRFYQAGQQVEPNKLRLCDTYNGEN